MDIGIDRISFYVPNIYLDMKDLAHARNEDPNKYTIGLGQEQMALAPLNQDIVSLAANAADRIVNEDNRADIDLVILAGESAIDFSKSAATSVHKLLKINPHARAVEMKQACYGTTSALYFALAHINLNPDKKALVISSDISKYGLNSAGEPTQGAGAVAMIVSAQPKILKFNQKSVSLTDDTWYFFRPSHSDYPIVDGHASNEEYRDFFEQIKNSYEQKYQEHLADFDALLFHIPYTKQGRKALMTVVDEKDQLMKTFDQSVQYNKRVGNIYAGSLYLNLISLLENANMKAKNQIGFFSYGSGSVAEFFSGELVEGYEKYLFKKEHQKMLDLRKRLSVEEYEKEYLKQLKTDGSHQILEESSAKFSLKEIKNNIRYYHIKK